MLIDLLACILVGVVVGFIGSKAVNLRGDDPKLGMAGAVAGSIVAGLVYTVVSDSAARPWDAWLLFWATIGAILGAVAWHVFRSRSISHRTPTTRHAHR